MLRSFLENHVLANVTFVVVLVIGILTFLQLPRAKDPEINFNWISVVTSFPGASAEDVEKLVTDPLEEAIQQVSDIKFVSSDSRQSVSSILVRFEEISSRTFDKRMNDLRREIQAKTNDELPDEAEDPLILEITTANSFPTAMIAVRGSANDEILRETAMNVKEDIERIDGVDGTDPAGLHDPELQVVYYPDKLQAHGISPSQLADTVNAYFRDVSAGKVSFGSQNWLVRLEGKNADPTYLESLPIITAEGAVPIRSVADVNRGRKEAAQLVLNNGQPAVLMAITKKAYTNTLELVDRINDYIEQKNKVLAQLGVEIVLIDDQTLPTSKAIDVMQTNALLGLVLVMLVTWVFLGAHIAFFIGIGIPFTLAGTFWILGVTGETLNQSTLLAIVIVLGMLVDDAVVVVESIYYRLQRGGEALASSIQALAEVFKPVTASVLTTMAAFLPLMLLPGILGDFMFVIPYVVTVALAVSLLEAYWMLPVHISMMNLRLDKPSGIQMMRVKLTHWLRLFYSRRLVWVLRHPYVFMLLIAAVFAIGIGFVANEQVKTKFFAFDPIRLYYINVEMPPGSQLEETLRVNALLEKKARAHLQENEIRETAAVAGQMFTEMGPHFGDQYGQVIISLAPQKEGMRGVLDVVESMREDVMSTPGPARISFLTISDGPPTAKPINVKVRGDDYKEVRAAADELKNALAEISAVKDILDDDSPGSPELRLKMDADAVKRSGVHAADLARMIRLMFDGEVVARMQNKGETLEVRVMANEASLNDIDDLLRQTVPVPTGGEVALGQLLNPETTVSKSNIRHYDYRRTVTIEADLNKDEMDTVQANALLQESWEKIRLSYPGVDLDFSGELDDIQESIDSMVVLFIFGIGLMYLILGTQFRSYWQPFMILATVPLAFIGVIYGLTVSGNPLSLFTLYGVVALTGIAVNSAIVMIDAANTRMQSGMSVLHSTIYAARRRVVPILITSLTTIAGLLSLAIGLGGKSLIWGPVASAIVWGLAFSTLLTLFVIPMMYRFFMVRSKKQLA